MDHSSLPRTQYNIVVVGGGVSGSMAAIAAARCGASVLLIEEQGFLGGTLTAMGVGPMMSFHNSAGKQVVKGLPDELICRLQKRGASPGHIPDTTTYCHTVTPFDTEELKIELETMLAEAGGTALFHTQLASVERNGNKIARLQVCNKAGLTAIQGRVFIDATGDGDLAVQSGAAFQLGRPSDHASQPMTMNLKLGNVDTRVVRQYAMDHPENFLWEHGRKEGLRRLQTSPRLSLAGYLFEWNQAQARGEVHIPRDQVLFFETATPGVVIVNTSRILSLDPTNPWELSRAEITGRAQCAELFEFLRKRCAGFTQAIRMDTSAKIGVRESRHIRGLYTLTAEDLTTGRHFEDGIARGGYPIDIHSPDGAKTASTHVANALSYEIPMRSLMVPGIENLVVAGRCISATHEASAAIRVTPIAMAIGQAGGVLAARALLHGDRPQMTPYPAVAAALRDQDAIL